MTAIDARLGRVPRPEPLTPLPATSVVVLDTNVVLGWLLFDDPRCDRLADAIVAGAVRWIASAAMRAELDHVLARGIGSARAGDPQRVREGWDRWSIAVAAADRPSPPAMRCTDADDQKFIDLALQYDAAALLSRDRAVLRLARRASALGLTIVSGDTWPPVR